MGAFVLFRCDVRDRAEGRGHAMKDEGAEISSGFESDCYNLENLRHLTGDRMLTTRSDGLEHQWPQGLF